MERENYWIDPKLKEGKHYPTELIRLIEAFNGKRVVTHIGKRAKLRKMQEGKEVGAIEKMFQDYFFYQARVLKFQKYSEWGQDKIKASTSGKEFADKIKVLREDLKTEWHKEFGTEKPGLVIEAIIKKVNAKLKLAHPELLSKSYGPGFYLEPITIYGKRRFFLRDQAETFTYWELLAKVIATLNPRLVHRCQYEPCSKIYFSLQRKKYHSECRSKFLSEKYRRDGTRARIQREYRERKKLENRRRKKA
jgi:hypothetical protein